MRHKILRLMILTAGLLLLSGCTSSETQIGQSSGTSSGSGTSDAQPADSGTSDVPSAPEADQPAGDADVSSVPEPDQPDANPAETEAMPAQQTGEDVTIQDVDETGTDQTGEEDPWSGLYVGENDTLTISPAGEGSISFSFVQAGIAGTASVDGSQAVYKGDDYHAVVFVLDGNTVNVAVTSEEDFDTASSPLNGTYTKE